MERKKPSLSELTYEEFTREAEKQRKAPTKFESHKQRSYRFVKKAMTIGAIVVASMYAGAKYNESILGVEKAVTNYFSQPNEQDVSYNK